MTRVGYSWRVSAIAACMLAAAVVAVCLSERGWSLPSGPVAEAIWRLRLARMAMGMVAGSALALAGMTFQAVFRNPLASPYTLGVSVGASVAVTIGWALDVRPMLGPVPTVVLLALAGGLASVVLVYGIARSARTFSSATLLLAGVSVTFIGSAAIMLVYYLADRNVTNQTIRWTMGNLEVPDFRPLWWCLPALALGTLVLAALHRDLNLLMMGELVAASRGVNVARSRRRAYFVASAVVAIVVAYCGPIGFVGLMVPHIVRSIVGPSHARLLPACVLGGAAFLPLCDGLARATLWWTTGQPQQIPVGVLTSLLGGGFFLYILLSRRQDTPIG